jgi:hypothetical protein
VPEPGSQAGPGQAGKRVWVVRVVRREAVVRHLTPALLLRLVNAVPANSIRSGRTRSSSRRFTVSRRRPLRPIPKRHTLPPADKMTLTPRRRTSALSVSLRRGMWSFSRVAIWLCAESALLGWSSSERVGGSVVARTARLLEKPPTRPMVVRGLRRLMRRRLSHRSRAVRRRRDVRGGRRSPRDGTAQCVVSVSPPLHTTPLVFQCSEEPC